MGVAGASVVVETWSGLYGSGRVEQGVLRLPELPAAAAETLVSWLKPGGIRVGGRRHQPYV